MSFVHIGYKITKHHMCVVNCTSFCDMITLKEIFTIYNCCMYLISVRETHCAGYEVTKHHDECIRET